MRDNNEIRTCPRTSTPKQLKIPRARILSITSLCQALLNPQVVLVIQDSKNLKYLYPVITICHLKYLFNPSSHAEIDSRFISM